MSNYNLAEHSVLPPDAKRTDLPRRDLLTPLPEEGHYLLVIDNSSAERIRRCHTAGAYYLFYTREGQAHDAALGFGGAVHVGLECIEAREGKEWGFEEPESGTIVKAIWTEADTAKAVVKYFTDNPQPPDEYRTAQTALEVLAHYRVRKTLPDYHWKVLQDSEGLIVERPFELPLGVLEVNAPIQLPQWPEPRFIKFIHVAWSGKIDIVPEINGKPHIADNKTTKIAGDRYTQGFMLSSQTIGYVWAGRQLWPELNLKAFCLNAIHLKKSSPGRSLVEKGPRGGEPPLNFFRAYFEYSDQRIADWAEDALLFVEDFVHSMVRGRFPLNDHGCINKYGLCPYFDVCTIDEPEVRLRFLMSDAYKNVTWDPTK